MAPTVIDRETLIGSSAIGLLVLLVAALIVGWKRWRGRDEIFTNLTPGLVPAPGQSASRTRLRSQEYSGPVAVAFTPPADVSPGVLGTIIDGEANAHDVSATLIDLAARGWMKIVELPPDAAAGGPEGNSAKTKKGRKGKPDWKLVATTPPASERVTPLEDKLLSGLFRLGPEVRLSELKGGFGVTMREAQIGLYQEVVDRGWYAKHPKAKNSRARFAALVLIVPIALIGLGLTISHGVREKDWSNVPLAVGAILAVALLWFWGRGRSPRTAEGTAARIQALGFREYLATAEADQIRFEEARTLFSKYLPYAIAFGIAEHWAKVFGEVATRAQLAGWTDPFWDLAWFDGLSLGIQGMDAIGDVGSLIGDLPDLGAAFGDIAGAAGDAVDGVVSSVGEFADSADGLFSVGDGCDGCDLGGCDF